MTTHSQFSKITANTSSVQFRSYRATSARTVMDEDVRMLMRIEVSPITLFITSEISKFFGNCLIDIDPTLPSDWYRKHYSDGSIELVSLDDESIVFNF